MTDKVQEIREEVERLKSNLIHGACASQIAMETRCKEEAYNEVLAILDSSQEEPVSKDYRERYKRIAESEQFKKTHEGMSIGDIVPVEGEESLSEDLEKIVEEIAEPTILNAYGTKELARRLCNTICGTSVSEGLEEASKNYALNNTPWDDCKDEIQESFKAGAKWQKGKDESVTKDLGDYINELSKQFPEVSFAKLSRIAVRVAKWQKEKEYTCYEEAFEDGAKWKVENLWKPADGDDLPEYEREVIVLIKYDAQLNIHDEEYPTYIVGFGHRPNPDGWDGKNIDTNEVTHYTPKLYDKGGWNIPEVKYWLDVELPKEIEL